VIAIITISDGERHLAGIITNLVERIDLLDDGTLDHVVIPSATEIVIVKNIIHKLRLQILVISLHLDGGNRSIRSRLCENLQMLLGIISNNSETFIAVHDVEELLELLICGNVLLALLDLFRSQFRLCFFTHCLAFSQHKNTSNSKKNN